MKRCSTLFTVKEMQTKTTKCASFTYQIGKIFKSNNTQCWPRFGETWIYQHFGGSENLSVTLIQEFVDIFNILNLHTFKFK